jgi:hypothetical protein
MPPKSPKGENETLNDQFPNILGIPIAADDGM